uniref:Nuclear transcription factor Y subunit n=1 Tax=Kalanchoe fedtschenkoi TaxID=63787 RepID=A0A7N0TK77_KALFE
MKKNPKITSSVHDPSDYSEAEERQNLTEPQNQAATDVMMSHSGVRAPNVQYTTPLQLGTGHTMAPGAYPYPDPYYRSIFAPYDPPSFPSQSYNPQPMVHMQLMGMQQAGVPLHTDAVEEPVFVNAKQYHGILRRRQSRAKAESEKKLAKSRKPYLHESRHLHALRRARGCGGRFLNGKKNDNQQNEVPTGDSSQLNALDNSSRANNVQSDGTY